MRVLSRALAATAAVAAMMLTAAGADAAAFRAGGLDCHVGAGIGFVVTSSRALDCRYQPNEGGPIEHYVGTISRFGLDLGVTGPGYFAWAVFAETRPGPGSLAGEYIGGSAAASAVVGFGANGLIGGPDNAFVLQPISVEAQTGINVAAGVGEMRLEYVPPAGGRVVRHHARPRHAYVVRRAHHPRPARHESRRGRVHRGR